MAVKWSRDRGFLLPWLATALALVGLPLAADAQCLRTLVADVVAIDQPYFWNRYGAVEPQGMMYALRRDVVSLGDANGLPPSDTPLQAGRVMLRRDKRPRPLVLRMNEGDCLEVRFQNLLADPDVSSQRRVDEEAPSTRAASLHIVGMELGSMASDGSFVGANTSSVVNPGGSAVYRVYGEREGAFMIHSMGAIAGGEGDGGSISAGLFGALNVEPRGSTWYRSQVTEADLAAATTLSGTVDGYPQINYGARYTSGPYSGLPILQMLDGNQIVHSDLTAVVSGGIAQPSTAIYPGRQEPFREFTIIFHDQIGAVQAFSQFYEYELQHTLHGVSDSFAINYGTGGAGAEVLANRLGVGPVWDCVECKYEEFFLASWVVGDPAMVVDVPANAPCMVSTTKPNEVDKEPGYETRLSDLKSGVNCSPTTGPKATKAFFPEDPSNVYHSYLNDNVKFRNLHAGTEDHHIFHLHAHQWLHTPRSDLSSYRDSQAIGPGAGFTYEIAYGGSGNRNKTVGDSIFHCHFYPHFAQGMWSLWRVHDVLELGTKLDSTGRPAANSRALPDGEIAVGTPIPGVVPMPTLPMAPLPAGAWVVAGQPQTEPVAVLQARRAAGQERWNPGFPFWVPAVAGHRPPHPPLDTLADGGLSRHVVVDGTAVHAETRHDFHKDLTTLAVNWIPEAGTPIEDLAMTFHAAGSHPTKTPEGVNASFEVNANGRVRGAPYADPCPPGAPLRVYKAAEIQMDVVFNKGGWHNPQQRLITLLEDIPATLAGTRPPEPFFIRAKSGECIEFQVTNLVPNEWHLDDFQVRTPTDILGQHIHLVKFDVLASDGGGNGFNYEDGTFSPEEVVERLCAIRRGLGTCEEPETGPCNFRKASRNCPSPVRMSLPIGDYNPDCDEVPELLGAQTTVQRWWADPVLINANGGDRTLRTVFTHDHFGPSTHQQAGLYGGLIIEKANTNWKQSETGQLLGDGRGDGGPTSWQAVITNESTGEQFREFLLEFADFQVTYGPGGPLCPDTRPISQGGIGFSDPARAVNPPGRREVGPHDLYRKPDVCPVNTDDVDHPAYFAPFLPPCPEAVSADDPGMGVLNYRNEPIAMRVRDPSSNSQAPGLPGDLSFAYETRTDRLDPEFNVLPYAPFLSEVTYPQLTRDLRPGDPFTPLIRAYEGDRVVVRTLVGAHEEEHVFSSHGIKWLFEPDWANSGWRNSQHMGLSEWFDFEIPRVPSLVLGQEADFLYKPSTAAEFQWDGLWGLLRVYRGPRLESADSLQVLDRQNPDARTDEVPTETFATLSREFAEELGVVIGRNTASASAGKAGETVDEDGGILDRFGRVRIACPKSSVPTIESIRRYGITAVSAAEVLQNDGEPVPGLIYNRRTTAVTTWPTEPGEPSTRSGPLHDPTAIMFVYTSDLDYSSGRPRLKQDVRREPLILRANAGDCIAVTLYNDIPKTYQDQDGWNSLTMLFEGFNANDLRPSLEVGLHPQLVALDIRNGDGANVGINPGVFGKQTVAPTERITYFWYAGDYNPATNVATPIEFGSTNLTSSDPIKHANKGAIGALLIEPPGSTWTLHTNIEPHPLLGTVARTTRASAVVTTPSEQFREFVLLFQDNVNLRWEDGAPVESLSENLDPGESAQKALNYRTDPLWFRFGHAPDTPGEETRKIKTFHLSLSNSFIGGPPETPLFVAKSGEAARFRLLMPEGHNQGHVFDLHGHVWEELPYVSSSTRIGTNAASEWMGTRGGHGPGSHHEAVLKHGAGGKFGVMGDFLYRDYAGWLLDDGVWGLFRVE